ncbi:MAG: hypothetical protein K2P51_02365 [Rhabdochlamydiaceae bacterium]|nr:hypothetical protein [Rhabdochlamydiaceae bacterium]
MHLITKFPSFKWVQFSLILLHFLFGTLNGTAEENLSSEPKAGSSFSLIERLIKLSLLEDLCEFHRLEDLCEFHCLEDLCEFHLIEDLCEFHLLEDLCEFHLLEDLSEFHLLEDLCEFHRLEDLCEFHKLENLAEFHDFTDLIRFLCESRKPAVPKTPLIDLEEHLDDFVLETRKLEIPGYPDSFNPSVTKWKDSLVMCFRVRNSFSRLPDRIGFVFLDKEFNPIGEPILLEMDISNLNAPSKPQDPRLITIGDRLFMVFSDKLTPLLRRMYIAEVHFDGKRFYTEEPQALSEFENESKTRWEKNWVPFVYEDELLLSYSIEPHQVLSPIGNGKCATLAQTPLDLDWHWGPLHGGTPALLIDGQYLSFFQSHLPMASVQSEGKVMPHYFLGAYTFEAKPPFALTAASTAPIIGKHFYNGPACKTWKPMRVVFPTGFFADEHNVFLFYGRQDNEIWIAKLDKVKLLESLTPVEKKN